ncbi:MAG: purine nucleoside permease [Alphaproteobacteria bacterium]|nr:purine nucleoside permease [Alphaproteobacteria bacterium]MBU1515255.1 purine nucleoside permease [Alphaproteobacteria bacterium]MBU2092385.1 purine nucleoside permease [Alphaproteobacteria bacterium]MBU2152979.1 purine nucleoside permease [Alphaproteobacteria bacterium]MBU2305810.1 purine nucleoside permease [Alphaproteobacteria bacterium]
MGVHVLRLFAIIACLLAPLPALAQPKPIPIKVVVITAFEIGADTGDMAGEFQHWVERYPLTETVKIPGIERPARLSKDGVLGITTGMFGRARGSMAALLLDPRFDFSKAYFLMAGIAGVDPAAGSIGSASWSDYVVDADPLYEIDEREKMPGWMYGLYAFHSTGPDQKGNAEGASGMAWRLDPGLTTWAYLLTRNTSLPDNPKLAAERAGFTSEGAAQKPPHVFRDASLGTVRFWHGKERTRWARNWVRMQTDGQSSFAMSDGEDQAVMDTLALYAKEGRVDLRRALILRTASNYTWPGEGKPMRVEFAPGGLEAGVEAAYRVGSPVVKALVAGWATYETTLPQAK